MMRIRLLWFTLGLTVTGGAISHFAWRDLLMDRLYLTSDMKAKFDALETRMSNLEPVFSNNSASG